ncbi:hypothetical protein VBH15_09435 [Vagococcus fluvialis]|uniref:hypothetical protein n=1 Tax=Vagococcus fluvialis TaxID=2738 RepID=UPI0037CCF35A
MSEETKYTDPTGLDKVDYNQSDVSPEVKKHAKNVRTKMFGRHVRESIARAIEFIDLAAQKAVNIANKAFDKSEDTENRLDNQIRDLTSDSEIIDFRYSSVFKKTFNILKDRGDFWDNLIVKIKDYITSLDSHYTYLENQERLPVETDIGWINRVISEMDRGTLVFASKKTYYLNSAIVINRSDVSIDFNQAFLAYQGDIDYLIKARDFHNLKLKSILLTKVPDTVGSFIEATNGTGFQMINLFGVNLGLKDLGVFSGVHKSFIKEVYVTNSNDTLKGRGFVFNYCVNFDIENVMLSYFQVPFRWNNTKDPDHGFMNEGFTLRGIKTLKSSVAFQIDMCTSLTASDIVLDFNQSFGIYVANGTNIRVNNFWIGMQDNVRATGIELFKGLALSFKEGTVAGNWKAKDIQQAFYSNVDTNATFEDIYLIDVNGGILSYPKINVKNITYFQNKQKPVDVVKKGNYQSSFFGIRSIDNPLAITNAAVDIISVDSRNQDYYVISEGYVNSKGVATIKTLKRGAGVDIDHDVYTGGFNVTFTKGTFDPSYMQTIVRVSQVVKDVFMYDPEKDEWL